MDKEVSSYIVNRTVDAPGSKSETIRALLVCAFSKGVSTIFFPLLSDDTKSCIEALRALGAEITVSDESIEIDSRYLGDGIQSAVLDCGNSGTALYFLTSLVCSLAIPVTFKGDESLETRPVKPLLDALRALGAKVEGDGIPFTVQGPIKGGSCSIDCPTSQYLSSLLMGCSLASGISEIQVLSLSERPYIEMTFLYLADIQVIEDGDCFTVYPGEFISRNYSIGGDYSSAAMLFSAALCSKGSVTVTSLRRSSAQGDRGFLKILRQMGAQVEIDDTSVTVTYTGTLENSDFNMNAMPDCVPALAAVGLYGRGEMRITGISQLRIKETDRISLTVEALSRLGGAVVQDGDDIVISGSAGLPLKGGCRVDTNGDHRIAMACYAASLGCTQSVIIADADRISVSYPEFFSSLEGSNG